MLETMPASPNTVHCHEIPRFQREIYSPNLQLPKTFDSNFFTKQPSRSQWQSAQQTSSASEIKFACCSNPSPQPARNDITEPGSLSYILSFPSQSAHLTQACQKPSVRQWKAAGLFVQLVFRVLTNCTRHWNAEKNTMNGFFIQMAQPIFASS